jgi:hypothetical protein
MLPFTNNCGGSAGWAFTAGTAARARPAARTTVLIVFVIKLLSDVGWGRAVMVTRRTAELSTVQRVKTRFQS